MIPQNYTYPNPKYLFTTGEVIGQGAHHYDAIVADMNRLHPCLIAAKLAQIYPQDFRQPNEVFDAVDWLLLTYVPVAIILLADPSFRPAEFIESALDDPEVEDAMAESEVSSGLRLRPVLRGINSKLASLETDEHKAIWTALSFAKFANMERATLLSARWSEPAFIAGWQQPKNSRTDL